MLPANSDDLRRKLTLIQPQRSAPASYGVGSLKSAGVGAGSPIKTANTANNSTNIIYDPLNATTSVPPTLSSLPALKKDSQLEALRTTYGFSGSIRGSPTPTCLPNVAIVNPGINHVMKNVDLNVSGLSGRECNFNGSGHTRSVSHGDGVIFQVPGMGGGTVGSVGGSTGGCRTIKSALKGHQRAFSQGQIMDTATTTANVITSRGHNRVGSRTDFILPPGHKDHQDDEGREFLSNSSALPSSGSILRCGGGHSRQASRSESIYTLRRMDTPPWWKRITTAGGQVERVEERRCRIVVPNHTVPPKTPKRDHPNGVFTGNKIRTSKYTLLSFIPKNLFEQFHRVANLYFIFIVLLNWFPAINAFGKEVAMIPVLFVLGITAVKDLFEDRRRKFSDQRINNSTCRIYDG